MASGSVLNLYGDSSTKVIYFLIESKLVYDPFEGEPELNKFDFLSILGPTLLSTIAI